MNTYMRIPVQSLPVSFVKKLCLGRGCVFRDTGWPQGLPFAGTNFSSLVPFPSLLQGNL